MFSIDWFQRNWLCLFQFRIWRCVWDMIHAFLCSALWFHFKFLVTNKFSAWKKGVGDIFRCLSFTPETSTNYLNGEVLRASVFICPTDWFLFVCILSPLECHAPEFLQNNALYSVLFPASNSCCNLSKLWSRRMLSRAYGFSRRLITAAPRLIKSNHNFSATYKNRSFSNAAVETARKINELRKSERGSVSKETMCIKVSGHKSKILSYDFTLGGVWSCWRGWEWGDWSSLLE